MSVISFRERKFLRMKECEKSVVRCDGLVYDLLLYYLFEGIRSELKV